MKAVDQVLRFALDHGGASILREAPEEIQQIARNAQHLPDEIYHLAHRKLYGEWPEYLHDVEFDLDRDVSFIRRRREEICT